MIKLALDAFYRQALAPTRGLGVSGRWRSHGPCGDHPLIAAALADGRPRLRLRRGDRRRRAPFAPRPPPDRRDARRRARDPPRRDRLSHRRRAVCGSLRGVDGPRPARSDDRSRDRTGSAPADADSGDSRQRSACRADSSRQPSCWTARSRPRASRATTRRWRGISSIARSSTSQSRRDGHGGRGRGGERRADTRARATASSRPTRASSSRSRAWRAASPRRPSGSSSPAGGGEAMPLLPGGWRAKYLELLTRGWLLLGRRAEAERAAATPRAPSPQRRASAWRPRGRDRAAAAVALDDGRRRARPSSEHSPRPPLRRGRSRGRSRGLANAGRPRAGPGG